MKLNLIIFGILFVLFLSCQSSNKGTLKLENDSKKVIRVIVSKDSVLTKMTEGIVVKQHQKETVFEAESMPQIPSKLYFFLYEITTEPIKDVTDTLKRIEFKTQRLVNGNANIAYRESTVLKCEHQDYRKSIIKIVRKK